MKNIYFLLGLVMIAGLLLAACAAGGTAPQPPSTEAPSIAKTEPTLAGDTGGTQAVAEYVYEGLVRVQDGAPVGVLAESFTVSEDGLDYIFHLRPGVTFHDGSALTADVVIANFNRWFDPKDPNHGTGDFSAWAENFGGFKGEVDEAGKAKSIYDGIEKVDNLTVLIHLNKQDAGFLTKLSNPAFFIVSPSSFSGGYIGTGPYKVASSNETTVTLEPFTGYWDASAIPSKGMEIPVK
jgi:peptide/nickel transport system substrate-binding protein